MLKAMLLKLALMPADPEPPAGSPDSIRIFRASPNLFYWNLVTWAFLQFAILLLVIAGLLVCYRIQPKLPPWARVGAAVVQGGIVFMWLLQMIVSGLQTKFDYEMRWYMVTDRSLRIRWGIFFVREVTMTFANIQRVSLNQGPLQKILGIATVEVSTAGGGGGGGGEHGKGSGMTNKHSAKFEGVANAQEIRDLILSRLKKYRDTGLGDPDEVHEDSSEHEAALEVLAEVRRLSAVMGR